MPQSVGAGDGTDIRLHAFDQAWSVPFVDVGVSLFLDAVPGEFMRFHKVVPSLKYRGLLRCQRLTGVLVCVMAVTCASSSTTL